MDDDERIALFLDYENLALGAREHLRTGFDLRPISDALAERGRVVVRRAYADWSYFDEDRRMLTRSHVELIEMPQRMGASRKNAADIKMAVDAIEMAFARDYISTFVICTGDSDFTPLVHKLRELNKRVVGFGVRSSTSAMLPPACDEFLYYDDLPGVEAPDLAGDAAPNSASKGNRKPASSAAVVTSDTSDDDDVQEPPSDVAVLVVQTIAGLERSAGSDITASVLKRTLLRKDPTFSEADHGFRGFGELINHLADRGLIEISDGPAKGDPIVRLSERGSTDQAFALLRAAVAGRTDVPLSGLKDQIRRDQPDFTEKTFGYRSFLQFARAAEKAGVISLAKIDEGYVVSAS